MKTSTRRFRIVGALALMFLPRHGVLPQTAITL